jgi:hypothetical protein
VTQPEAAEKRARMKKLKVKRLKVERLKVERLKVERLKVERLKVERLKVEMIRRPACVLQLLLPPEGWPLSGPLHKICHSTPRRPQAVVTACLPPCYVVPLCAIFLR